MVYGGLVACRSCSWGPAVRGLRWAHNSSHCLGMAGWRRPAHPQGDPARVVGGLSPPLPPGGLGPPLAAASSTPSALISSFCSWKSLQGWPSTPRSFGLPSLALAGGRAVGRTQPAGRECSKVPVLSPTAQGETLSHPTCRKTGTGGSSSKVFGLVHSCPLVLHPWRGGILPPGTTELRRSADSRSPGL